MFFKRKNKKYYITIISDDKEESMYVTGKSKKEVKKMVIDVITKCELLKRKYINITKLKCQRIWRDK